MRRWLGLLAVLCLTLLPALARADAKPSLYFEDAALILFQDEGFRAPTPRARSASGKESRLSSTQEKNMVYTWKRGEDTLEAAPEEPGRYEYVAECLVDGTAIMESARLPVVMLPPGDETVNIEAPLLHARLLEALDADRDGALSVREAAASLDSLNLGNLQLADIPDELFALLPGVRALDLSHNDLRDLPDGLDAMLSMRTLDLSNNPLERLDAAFPPALRKLDVRACALDLDHTPDQQALQALRERGVEIDDAEQAPRALYLPIHLDPVTLRVAQRYQDPGFRWQTVRGNAINAPAGALPQVDTLLVTPEGEAQPCRYDRLAFDAPGTYKLCYTLQGSDVGVREIVVEGEALPTAPPMRTPDPEADVPAIERSTRGMRDLVIALIVGWVVGAVVAGVLIRRRHMIG